MTVTDDVYGTIDHISNQIMILTHSVYVISEYMIYVVVSVFLIAALLMFLTGFMVSKGRK